MALLASRGTSVIILLAFATCGSAQSNDSTCCNLQQKCKNLSTLDLKLQDHVYNSPYFMPLFSYPGSSLIASTCITYFNITKNTYLRFFTQVKTDGSYTVQKYITSDLSGDQTGIYRVQGQPGDLGNETSVFNTYIVDASCSRCEPIYITYECFFFSACEYINYEYDVVIGLSPNATNSPSCLDQFEEIVSTSALQVKGFTRATGTPKCVVYFYNATCVNGQNVDPAYAISYPDDSTACD